MNKWVEEFKRLLSKDRVIFVIHCLKSGFILLFLLGLVMPFAVGSTLTNGRVSMSALPGSIFYVLPQVIILLIYIFTVLNRNEKLPNLVFKIATVIASLTVLWGLIMFYVGFKPNGTDLGTGMMFMILFNASMWYVFIAEKKVTALISKYVKSSTSNEETLIETSKEE